MIMLAEMRRQALTAAAMLAAVASKKIQVPILSSNPPCVGHHQKYESDAAVALSTDSYLHLT